MKQSARCTFVQRICGVVVLFATILVGSLSVAQEAGTFDVADPFGGNLPAYKTGATKISESKTPQALQIQGPSESFDRIDRAMSDLTALVLIDVPLSEAVSQIGSAHDIPMLVDQRALEELGMSADVPVTIDLRNVALRSALRLMLRSLELDFIITNEVFQITSPTIAKAYSYGRIYTLPDSSFAEEDVASSLQRVLESKFASTGSKKTIVQYLRSNPIGSAPGNLLIEGTRAVHTEATSKLLLLRGKTQRPRQPQR